MNLKEFCDKNNYILKDKIDFEIDRYWDWIPSVTTILKLIDDPWFNFILKKYWDKVQESADRWTKTHNDAEDFFSWIWSNLNKNISELHSLFIKEIIWMETKYIKDWISWTIDLEAIVNIKWNEYEANIDYKNAKIKSEKYKIQLWWYEFLNWRRWIIAYVWKEKLELVQVEDFYKDIFIELKEYFNKLLNEAWQQQFLKSDIT